MNLFFGLGEECLCHGYEVGVGAVEVSVYLLNVVCKKQIVLEWSLALLIVAKDWLEIDLHCIHIDHLVSHHSLIPSLIAYHVLPHLLTAA